MPRIGSLLDSQVFLQKMIKTIPETVGDSCFVMPQVELERAKDSRRHQRRAPFAVSNQDISPAPMNLTSSPISTKLMWRQSKEVMKSPSLPKPPVVIAAIIISALFAR